ncbi:helix-turn-helix domain-containing protein, partial [Delftia tsuruhatensis]|uniref:helix-turn-helix domain-containing protein n=1 Tax=Delftia tsuruhatensis TaxID=180282 RepID=UPI001F0A1DF8
MQPRPRADTCRSWPSVRCCIAYPLAETRGQYGFPGWACLLRKSRFDLPFPENISAKALRKGFPGKPRSTSLQWDDARIFLAIARAGSLSGASAALGLGVATVSRRLDRLESALAMPLF